MAAVLIPDWYRGNHFLNLPGSIRKTIRREYNPHGIFLNIPYSKRYTNLEIAVLSTVTAYGLTPFLAKQESAFSVRLHKIARMMLTCKYAFTDLTYTKRMNMPFELGMLLAWGKESFVTGAKPYQSIKSISDLNFGDIHYHRGAVKRLIVPLSKWLRQQYPNKLQSRDVLIKRYRRWQQIRKASGEDFDQLTPQEIDSMIRIAQEEFQMKIPTLKKGTRKTK